MRQCGIGILLQVCCMCPVWLVSFCQGIPDIPVQSTLFGKNIHEIGCSTMSCWLLSIRKHVSAKTLHELLYQGNYFALRTFPISTTPYSRYNTTKSVREQVSTKLFGKLEEDCFYGPEKVLVMF